MTVLSTASGHYGTYTRRGGLATVLRIKLTDVIFVIWIRQWFSILRSQLDISRVVDLGHLEWALRAEGELVSTLLSEHPPEHKIIYLKLSAMHELYVVAFECLAVPYIFDSSLLSSLIDKVNIFMPELVLCGFIVCLDT
jgi:hypothetical protein